jgi:hypothetical protein
VYNNLPQTKFETLFGSFDIDDGGDAKSGLGANAMLTTRLRYPRVKGLSLEAFTIIQRRWYDGPDLRLWRGRLNTDVKRCSAGEMWRAGGHVDQIAYTETTSTPSDKISIGAHASWQEYKGDYHVSVNGVIGQRTYAEADLKLPIERYSAAFPNEAIIRV